MRQIGTARRPNVGQQLAIVHVEPVRRHAGDRAQLLAAPAVQAVHASAVALQACDAGCARLKSHQAGAPCTATVT